MVQVLDLLYREVQICCALFCNIAQFCGISDNSPYIYWDVAQRPKLKNVLMKSSSCTSENPDVPMSVHIYQD